MEMRPVARPAVGVYRLRHAARSGFRLCADARACLQWEGMEPGSEGGMPAIDLTVYCTDEQCKDQVATYKIAAEWSGGGPRELKTFGFANDECLDRVVRSAVERAGRIRLAEGESLGPMRIYKLEPKLHDYELERMTDLEAKYR
jgi:hypothetical protein